MECFSADERGEGVRVGGEVGEDVIAHAIMEGLCERSHPFRKLDLVLLAQEDGYNQQIFDVKPGPKNS